MTSYTDADGNTSTTSYNISGNPVSVNDGKGTTSYTYDSSTEHRGLVTSEDLGVSPALTTMTASYDPSGNASAVTYPNGLVASTVYDNAGNDVSLDYAKAGTSWLHFTQTPGSSGNTAAQTSPTSSQQFRYDNDGRLIQTQDSVPSTTTGTVMCTTRTYSLDRNSNRTSLTSYPDDGSDPSHGHCTTTSSATTWSGTYDQADRLTNSGYVYDTLGRTSSIPAGDVVGIGSHAGTAGTLAIGYYSNDLVASQAQGSSTDSFGLDPLQNRISSTSSGSTTTTNHYVDGSDSAAWTSTSATTWTRNLVGLAGLIGTIDQSGTVILDLANLHGDLVATVADDAAATGIASYSESTEFGAPRNPAGAPDSYGWLGQKRRSGNDLGGLILMGVRLYDPATGRFLSLDPVPGGTDNPYVYVTNPLDSFDLNGQSGFRKWIKKHWRGIAQGAIVVAGAIATGVCIASVVCGVVAAATITAAVAGGYYAAGNAGSRRWRWRTFAVTVATPYVTAGLGKWSGAIYGASRYAARHRLW